MREGWEEKMLKEIGAAQTGTTPKTADKENYGDFIPFIKPADIDINEDGEIRYDNDGLSKKGIGNGRKMPKDSILMVCIGATIGKVGFVDRDVSCNQQINALTVRKDFYPKFFYYALSTANFFEQVMQNSAQATLPIINKSKWECLTVKFPKSLPEQQRIVAILDEAFAAIAKAKANAEQNLNNAKELFESYLQSVFENKGEGWEEKTLIEITTKIGSGATPRGGNESYKIEGISLVRSMNVHDFEFRAKNLAFIDDQQAKELNNVTLQENDVLLNITGASVARCCIMPKEYLPARVNQHVSIIRAKKEIIDPAFLNLLLTSKFYKDQLLFTGEQGATRQAITKAQLEIFSITFPKSLKEQQTIVRNLDALSTETKKLETIYQQKINDLEELKKSVLQKAFNGELTGKAVVAV